MKFELQFNNSNKKPSKRYNNENLDSLVIESDGLRRINDTQREIGDCTVKLNELDGQINLSKDSEIT